MSGAVKYLVDIRMIFCANPMDVVSVLVQHLYVHVCEFVSWVYVMQFVLGQHFFSVCWAIIGISY